MIWFSVLGTNVFTSKCKTNFENIFFIVNRPLKRMRNQTQQYTLKKNLHKIDSFFTHFEYEQKKKTQFETKFSAFIPNA